MPRKTASLRSETVELVLLMHPSRSISDDHWEEIDALHIEVWRQVAALFSSYQYESDERVVRVKFDWTLVIRRLRETFRIMKRIHDPSIADKYAAAMGKFPHRPVRVNCRVTVSRKKSTKLGSDHIALDYAESFLYDLFVILNLAAPGCCSFWRAVLRARNSDSCRLDQSLSLSEYSFDLAYLDSYEKKWPCAKLLDLEKVSTWYRSVRTGINQLPGNRAEKVLFGLMHISKTDLSIDTIIWFFYALETLYDTQPGREPAFVDKQNLYGVVARR